MTLFVILLFEFKNFFLSFVSCSEISVLKWDQNINDFVLIVNKSDPEDVDERHTRVIQSRLLETHNFQKAPVRIGYYEERPIMVTYDNGTKITGVVGEIWSTLSEHLNFTPVLVRVETGIFSKINKEGVIEGVIGLLLNGDIDVIPNGLMFPPQANVATFLSPYWDDSLNFFIRPEYTSNKSWLLKIFSFSVLIFIILIMMIFSALGLILEKISNQTKTQKNGYGIQDHLFYTFAAFCSQGSSPKQHDEYKIFEFSRRIFTWFLLLTVSSHLISLMTRTEVNPPFRTFTDLLVRTNYEVIFLEGSLVKRKFAPIINKYMRLGRSEIIKSRVGFISSNTAMYQKVCNSKDTKYAIVETFLKQYSKEMKMCKLEPTGLALDKLWSSAIISFNYTYKRPFDIGIIRLREVGLLSRLKRSLTLEDHEILNSNPTVIEFQHIYILFIILLLGSSVSVIILAGENIFFWCYQRKKHFKSKRSMGKKRFKKLRKAKRNYIRHII